MNKGQVGEVLMLLFLFLGGVSSTFTVRSAGNYVNLYDALAGLDLRVISENYTLKPEVLVSVAFQLSNPTPYQGLRVESFYLFPKAFQSSSSSFPMDFNSYAINLLTPLRNEELPGHANRSLTASFSLKGQAVEQFRQFYEAEGPVTLVYEVTVRLHSILDRRCSMTVRFTPEGTSSTCSSVGGF